MIKTQKRRIINKEEERKLNTYRTHDQHENKNLK